MAYLTVGIAGTHGSAHSTVANRGDVDLGSLTAKADVTRRIPRALGAARPAERLDSCEGTQTPPRRKAPGVLGGESDVRTASTPSYGLGKLSVTNTE